MRGAVSTPVRRGGLARCQSQYPMASKQSVPYHTGPHQALVARHPRQFPAAHGPSPTRAWAGKTTPVDVDGHPGHGRRARVTSRAHETIHAPSPPDSTQTQARASAAGCYEHWP